MGEEVRHPMTTRLTGSAVNDRPWPVELDSAGGRFMVRDGREIASLTFHVRGATMSLLHTEVPPGLRGKKVAVALARTAIEYARDHGLRVKVYCPFVAGYIERHPEYQDLVVK